MFILAKTMPIIMFTCKVYTLKSYKCFAKVTKKILFKVCRKFFLCLIAFFIKTHCCNGISLIPYYI